MNIGDVAKAVAGTVTNALMSAAKGWIGFGSKKSDTQPKVKIEPATKLPAR